MLKKYNITQEQLAKWLGYSNINSFNNSTAKDRILKGINRVIIHIEEEIVKKIDS